MRSELVGKAQVLFTSLPKLKVSEFERLYDTPSIIGESEVFDRVEFD